VHVCLYVYVCVYVWGRGEGGWGLGDLERHTVQTRRKSQLRRSIVMLTSDRLLLCEATNPPLPFLQV